MSKVIDADQAARLIPDGAVVTVSSSSGLGCPDATLAAIGRRFEATGHPQRLTTLHPIAAGDMWGIKGIDHIARPGLLSRIIAGSYPSGPSSAEPPQIWRMIAEGSVAAYNVPSGILFDMHRDAAAKRPGVLTKVGLDTFVDPARQGCAMNAAASAPIVRKMQFEGQEWLFFPVIVPEIAIIRATTADERGNLTYEHEGAYLGALDQALAAHNNGGIVIAQVKRLAQAGTLKPHDVHVPGILVDHIVIAPDQLQTTQTAYDPAISGEIFRPLDSFRLPGFDVGQDHRAAGRPRAEGAAGRSISASASRPMCRASSWKRAAMAPSPGSSSRAPSAACRCSTSSSAAPPMPRPSCPPRISSPISRAAASTPRCSRSCRSTARARSMSPPCPRGPMSPPGAGGFVDITAQAKRIVFSGYFNAGAKLAVEKGQIRIEREGKVKKLVPEVDHVSFSGRRAVAQGQEITYVTERCVMKLTPRRGGRHRDRAGHRSASAMCWPRRISRCCRPTT